MRVPGLAPFEISSPRSMLHMLSCSLCHSLLGILVDSVFSPSSLKANFPQDTTLTYHCWLSSYAPEASTVSEFQINEITQVLSFCGLYFLLTQRA